MWLSSSLSSRTCVRPPHRSGERPRLWNCPQRRLSKEGRPGPLVATQEVSRRAASEVLELPRVRDTWLLFIRQHHLGGGREGVFPSHVCQ